MTTVTPELLSIAAEAAYIDGETVPALLAQAGFIWVDYGPKKSETGFYAAVWKNEASGDYIVAYRGTESLPDFYADANFGIDQHKEPAGGIPLLNWLALTENISAGATIHFTGHSLGGGLAQYGAYTFAGIRDDSTVTLTTFNAFGAISGMQSNLAEFDGGISQTTINSITATHYRIANDAVSLLGNAHLGGQVLVIDKGDLTPIEAHGIGQFTGTNLMTPPADFAAATLSTDAYLNIDSAQLIAATIANFGAEGDFSQYDDEARAALVFVAVLVVAPDEEVAAVVEAFSPWDLPDTEIVALRDKLQELLGGVIPSLIGMAELKLGMVLLTEVVNRVFASDTNVTFSIVLKLVLVAEGVIANLVDYAQHYGDIRDHILADGPLRPDLVPLYGSLNADTIDASNPNASPWLSAHNEIAGYAGDDIIAAGPGADILYGNEGNDTLIGGTGNDILLGGPDDDIYIFGLADGSDLVADADSGSDRIEVDGVDLATLNWVETGPRSGVYKDAGRPGLSIQYDGASPVIRGSSGELTITISEYLPVSGGDFGIVLTAASPQSVATPPSDAFYVGETYIGGELVSATFAD